MDKDELQKNIALYYSKLPPEAQKFFAEQTWLRTLQTIAAKYSLSGEDTRALGTETTLALLGIINPEEFELALVAEMKIPADQVHKIALEAEDQVLKNLKSTLVDAFVKNNEVSVEQKETSSNDTAITNTLPTKLENVPQGIKAALLRANYHETLYNISKTYALNVDQLGMLEELTNSGILGTTPPEKLEGLVKSGLSISEEIARKVVNDINDKILKKVREDFQAQTEKTNPPQTADILTHKLSAPIQAAKSSTDHSLNNLPKAPGPSNNYNGPDPYRMPLE